METLVNNIHGMLKRVHYLRTRLCLSGAMGCWASVGLSSLRACRQNWKILMRSVSSNCFLALKCVSQGRPTSEDLTVVAYSCIIALKMLHPIICIWKLKCEKKYVREKHHVGTIISFTNITAFHQHKFAAAQTVELPPVWKRSKEW